jgi:hypothetical protein
VEAEVNVRVSRREEGDDTWGLQISDRRVFGGHPSPYQNMMTCVCGSNS